MKIVATLVLLLALSLSDAYRQELELELSSPEVQEYMNELIDGDEDDFEIIDVDDALRKARILKAMAHLIDEAEAMEVGHPRKRFIGSIFKKLGHVLQKAAKKVGDFFSKTFKKAMEHFKKATHGSIDFKATVNKLIPFIHSGESVNACERAVMKAAVAILGSAAPVASVVSKPLCEAALSQLQKLTS